MASQPKRSVSVRSVIAGLEGAMSGPFEAFIEEHTEGDRWQDQWRCFHRHVQIKEAFACGNAELRHT